VWAAATRLLNNEEFFWEHRFTIASFHEVSRVPIVEHSRVHGRALKVPLLRGALNCCFVQGSKHNCGLVEAEFHRRHMHLPHGFNRLWSRIGSGSSHGNERGTHHCSSPSAWRLPLLLCAEATS
jgi:hypothetical protein